MSNNKSLLVRSAITFYMVLLLASPTVNGNEGEKLFQQHCSHCHHSATAIKTSPDKIMPLLTSGTIRPHRFNLDDDTLESIITYIQQVKS